MSNQAPFIANVAIRWLIRSDMPQVLAIESASFDYPCTDDDFTSQLSRRQCIGMIAEEGNQVVGFMIYELNPGCLNLLNLAVHPQHTRQGIGSVMVERLVSKLWQQGRERIAAKVWERNLVAQQFFRAAGFRVVDTVPGDYESASDDDAYLFQFNLKESA